MTEYLYRKWRRAVTLLALVMTLLLPVAAQWRAPRPERTTARAIGVLETFSNGAQRLVPVALFYERRYFDAGLYRAAPVPFTISPQTVYEVQHFGQPMGTFTVWRASTSPEGFWVGAGVFRASPDPATLVKARKAAAPVVLEDPTRPVLHRRAGSEGDRPVARETKASAPAEEDPERPKLHRKDDVTDSSSEKTDRQAKRTGADAVGSSTEPAQDSAADRPILRRGKPAQEQSGADLPSPDNSADRNRDSVKRQVAISDAGHSEPQELLFALSEAQRQQMESAARELARSELLRLAPMRGLNVPPALAASAQPEMRLEDEQFAPYVLDYRDYATVAYSARYRPSAAGTASSSTAAERSWVVTVIARQDGEKLTRIYSAVSDPRELDLYPEIRLVDAVDPEGYGRFALLFRERKRDGVSWLIGRISGYELQTVFETAAR